MHIFSFRFNSVFADHGQAKVQNERELLYYTCSKTRLTENVFRNPNPKAQYCF